MRGSKTGSRASTLVLISTHFHLINHSTDQTTDMSYSVGSSEVGDYEEDPNIPNGVDCCGSSSGENDDLSISSEVSDQSMEHDGLTYNCKPDISEVANMTKAVNYGDFANMASDSRGQFESQRVVLGALPEGDAQNLTWSQLLDTEGRQPRLLGEEQRSKSFIWTRGYDEAASLSAISLVFPEPFSSPHKLTRRPSDMNLTRLSCPLLRQRPRPISAIKRFLARKTDGIPIFVKESSFNTADTTKSNRCI